MGLLGVVRGGVQELWCLVLVTQYMVISGGLLVTRGSKEGKTACILSLFFCFLLYKGMVANWVDCVSSYFLLNEISKPVAAIYMVPG